LTKVSDDEGVESSLTPRHILIVDDNYDCAETFAVLLKMQGHSTELAHDGESALAKAYLNHPDVILLDIGMPNLDGLQVCKKIRSEPWGRAVIIVAQTGWGTSSDRMKTTEAGFDAHLVKPIDGSLLLQTLNSLCNRSDESQNNHSTKIS